MEEVAHACDEHGDETPCDMTPNKLRLTMQIRDRAYIEGDTQTVKECDAMIEEHYREDMAKAQRYMAAHRLTVPKEYFLQIGEN